MALASGALRRRALLQLGRSMPETIGFLVLNAVFEGGTIAGFGITAGTAAIVGNVVLAGALVGANYALQQKTPEATQQDGQISIRQPRSVRRRNYGTNYIGGALQFSETKAGIRYQVLALSHGEIDSFLGRLLGDLGVTLDGSGNVLDLFTLGGTSYVQIYEMRGTDSDPAYSILTADFPDIWTSAHQGKGIAKVLTITRQPADKDFTKVYPGGQPPVYRAYIRGARVWDPRDVAQNKDNKATWTWTSNSVLIALDFHRHADGMGLAAFDSVFFTAAAISEDWIPAANICDEAVPLKAGGAEVRYACSGGYELPAPPKEVLNAILLTCDGETYMRSDGAIGIRVGKSVEPSITISDRHILSYSNFVRGGSSGLTPVNVVTAKFTSPPLGFQEAEADPWRDEDSIEETGREENRALDLTWVQSHSQARRLMKVAHRRFNPEWSGQVITDLDGLRAWSERHITLQISELGIDGPFEMSAPPEIMPGSGTVLLSVQSIDQLAYDWDPEHEEGTAPNVADTTSEDDAIDDPTGLSASVASHIITATWDASTRIDTTPRMQYRVNPTGPWNDATIDSGTSGHTPPLAAAHYDIQVQFTVGSHSSGWTALLNINVT
ncbi:hypothetical protein [Tardiphaga sp. 367_B4_N1_1]|uniref:hypothetical protein n=1 Tax=Tardiphaga sp. 367_B4_N1_1 TaxID=3240777 RepID=UPI003F274A96